MNGRHTFFIDTSYKSSAYFSTNNVSDELRFSWIINTQIKKYKSWHHFYLYSLFFRTEEVYLPRKKVLQEHRKFFARKFNYKHNENKLENILNCIVTYYSMMLNYFSFQVICYRTIFPMYLIEYIIKRTYICTLSFGQHKFQNDTSFKASHLEKR